MTDDPRLPPPVFFGTRKWLDSIRLEPGAHLSRDLGVCLMEAVAAYSGDRHTDDPKAVDPLLRFICWGLNDGLVWERASLEPRLRALVPGLAAIKEIRIAEVQPMAEAWLDWDAGEWMRLAGIESEATRPVSASRCVAHVAVLRRSHPPNEDIALSWSTHRSTWDGFGIEEMLLRSKGKYAGAHMAATAIAQSCAFILCARPGGLDLMNAHKLARQESAVELLERIVALHQAPPEVTP